MDDLAVVEEELELAVRELERSERADVDGRVTNEPEWNRALRRKRARVAELEARRAGLIADRIAEAEGFTGWSVFADA